MSKQAMLNVIFLDPKSGREQVYGPWSSVRMTYNELRVFDACHGCCDCGTGWTTLPPWKQKVATVYAEALREALGGTR